MEIETYEMNEVRESCIDDKNELLALANQLGAKGQLKILESGDSVKTFPYRKITTLEKRVYETLFSSQTELKNFSESIIPVRVMQIAAHAIAYPETCYLTVWHNRSFQDPVLIGTSQQYGSEMYILARWGEALESLNVLKKKAIEILRPKMIASLSDIKIRLSGWETDSYARLENYLNGEASYAHPQYFE